MEYASVGLEGMLSYDWVYCEGERFIKKLKNIHIRKDNYGSFRFFYVDNDKNIIGCLQVVSRETLAIASNIFVREDNRRKGISGILINKAYQMFPNMEFSENTNYMSEGMIKKYRR